MGCCQSTIVPQDPPASPRRSTEDLAPRTREVPQQQLDLPPPRRRAPVPQRPSIRVPMVPRQQLPSVSTEPRTRAMPSSIRVPVVPRPSQLQSIRSSSPSSSRRSLSPRGSSLSLRSSSSQDSGTRAQSIDGGNRTDSMPTSVEHAARRVLTSTVRHVLFNHPKFRILVVGMRGSGKSSLINAVFKVNISFPGSQATLRASGGPDINYELRPEENRYLIVHEYSGFESGGFQGLQTIRDFIIRRTDPSCSNAERLHAIWICIPTIDVISGSFGEGVEAVLGMRRVPVVVAFTKFDQAVAIEGGDSSLARASAYTQYEQSCHRKGSTRDVPREIVSVRPQHGDLINNLVVTTDTGLRNVSNPSAHSSAQGEMPQIAPIPLVWSAASRVNQDIIIQASIEVGRSRYWRSLWSSPDFADQSLKNCVDTIHTDIIDVWNLKERDSCLSNAEFKAKMSHVVKDLAGSVGPVPSSSPDFAEWVEDVYQGSQENVRCMMGYIVDLTVILDDVFRATSGDVSANDAQSALDRHIHTGRRDRIHRDIQSFVTDMFFNVQQGDLVLEKIINLIRQYCVPLLLNSNRNA